MLISDKYVEILEKDLQAELSSAPSDVEAQIVRSKFLKKLISQSPFTQPTVFMGPPLESVYNEFMDSCEKDMQVIEGALDDIGEKMNSSAGIVAMSGESAFIRLDSLAYIAKSLNPRPEHSSRSYVPFAYLVSDADVMDITAISSTPVSIDTDCKLLTLNIKSSSDVTSSFSLSIGAESNGFPGDTHTVYMTPYGLRFNGEDDMHADLRSMTDGDPNTYFEYELINVDEASIDSVRGYGFTYKEGLSWVGAGPLRLQLVMTAASPQKANAVRIYPSQKMGMYPCLLRSVLIDDGKGSYSEIRVNQLLERGRLVTFPAQMVQKITIELEQSNAYQVQIGVINAYDYLGEMIPPPRPSIRGLGLRYDPSTRSVLQPATNDYTPPDQNIIYGLQAAPYTTIIRKPLIAKRYVISISEISVAYYEYETQSEFVSHAISFPGPISEMFVVPEFRAVAGTSVSTYVSFDDCKTWIPVDNSGTRRFVINQIFEDSSVTRIPVNLDRPPDSLRVRFILSSDTTDVTPVVTGFYGAVLTGGDTIA